MKNSFCEVVLAMRQAVWRDGESEVKHENVPGASFIQ